MSKFITSNTVKPLMPVAQLIPLSEETARPSAFQLAREEVRKQFSAKQATQGIFGENIEHEDEESLRFLEQQIPALASSALKLAYQNALASGANVLEAVDGALVATAPDGNQQFIQALPPAYQVSIGSKRVRRAG